MNFGVLFEKVTDRDFPAGYYYAHVPSLGLTTHGLGACGSPMLSGMTDLHRELERRIAKFLGVEITKISLWTCVALASSGGL